MADRKKIDKREHEPESNPRVLAAGSLVKWEKYGKYAGIEACSVLDKSGLSEADRRLYTALVFGVVERATTLDHIIGSLTDREVAGLDPIVRSALRLGIYQLLYMDRIPAHAAVWESVALVPKKSSGFVNGILRSFIRNKMEYPTPDANDRVAYMSVKYSMPAELCRFIMDSVGDGEAEAFLAASFGSGRNCLRVNTLKCSVDEAVRMLRSMGANPQISAFAKDVLVLGAGSEFISGIDGGLWFVQDEASAAAVEIFAPEPGSLVFDSCAAPGGKSFGCGIAMGDRGKIVSMDLHENKLSLIRGGAARLGIGIIDTVRGDARNPPEALIGRADFVLCDAPCSGLGVIAKKPDIRYKSVDDIKRLPELQYNILTGASKCVRPGGTLMYSTCTVNPAENEDVFRRFAAENPDFSPAPFSIAGTGESGYAVLFPQKTGTDGFFISKFVRRESACG